VTLIDSSFWIAVFMPSDREHSTASELFARVGASFALVRRLRIREALAFNGDFAAAGFVELRA
jgi:predicted nucleic acid-binding protein